MARRITIKSPYEYKFQDGKYEQVKFNEGSILVRRDYREPDSILIKEVWRNDCYRLNKIKELLSNDSVIVDVGAHIGTFSCFAKSLIPDSRIFSYECVSDNFAVLRKNCEPLAVKCHKAAVTYEKEVKLYSSVFTTTDNTGGSTVFASGLKSFDETNYRVSDEPIVCKTLEDVLFDNKIDHIDLLKMDCEGSEIDILRNTVSLDKIDIIVGEWHDREQFMNVWNTKKFSDWHLEIMQDGKLGLFCLLSPNIKDRLLRHV